MSHSTCGSAARNRLSATLPGTPIPHRYDIRILCLESPLGPFGLQLKREGYSIASFIRKPGFDISLIGAIRKYIRQQEIHILHCHQYTPFVYGAFAAACSRTAVIFTEHGRLHPDIRRRKRILMNPMLRRLACKITAISDATRESLVRFENIPHDAIRVVYNGIDDQGFQPAGDPSMKSALGIPEDAFVLGAVARLDAIKNHALMIRSLKRVRSLYSNACLVIIGDGSERSSLEHLADELELRDHVLFMGYREDAAAFYQIMDIFLLTSFSEGTAMTLLEAMASAIPCIATNVGGNPEVVSNGNTGFIVPSGDESALTDAVCRLLGDRNLRQKMALAGRKRFEEKFTVSRMVEEYQAIYDMAVRNDSTLRQGSRRN